MSDNTSSNVLDLSDATYDKAKFVALVLLPAIGSLYAGVAAIWGLPAAQEVVATIVVIDTFLGILLGVSTKRYDNNPDGTLGITGTDPDTGMPQLGMTITRDPNDLVKKGHVRLKVEEH